MFELDYSNYVAIDEGIFWVGYQDSKLGLHSNPYLIVEGDEAVLIDGGSRPDFSTVMLKIMQVGIKPDMIKALIYHHYDPDLCGSISHFERIIDNDNLKIISQRHNNTFISHYATTSKKHCINTLGNEFKFKTGRTLKFINTPYAHSPGSFVTFDERTGTLFSSDIFGSYSHDWELYLTLKDECHNCNISEGCPYGSSCFMIDIEKFHKLIMTSNKSLQHALDSIESYEVTRVAPQHGSVIQGRKNVLTVIDKLRKLEGIGIDGALDGKIY